MTWAVYEQDTEVDVVPLKDLRTHLRGIDCPCRPRRADGAQNVIVHNAYDGREKYAPDYKGLTC